MATKKAKSQAKAKRKRSGKRGTTQYKKVADRATVGAKKTIVIEAKKLDEYKVKESAVRVPSEPKAVRLNKKQLESGAKLVEATAGEALIRLKES